MHVSVETLNDLERRVTVQVPAEHVAQEMQNRFRSLCQRAKIDGFRPGKAPLKVVKRMYGDQVRYETLGELMEHSLRDALIKENLQPLGTPKLEPKKLEEGQDLEYSATFEIMPAFELSQYEQLSVEKPVAEVTQQDVDRMVESLRQQRAVWNPVERPAQMGDRVRLDFNGTIDGQVFAGGQRENAEFILGKGTMLPQFEEGVIGASAGTETEFDVTFPEDYRSAEVAGKGAHFQIKLRSVEEAHLPEVDDAFAETFDVKTGGVAALRQSLRENMERELLVGIKTSVKKQVLQRLLEVNTIPLPRILVHAEIEQLAQQLQVPVDADDERSQQFKTYLFETEARRRVALGLLTSRLAAVQDIKVDEERVRQQLYTIAAAYEVPAEVVRWYEQTPRALDDVRALVLEDQVVDWLLERAYVTEKTSSFAEVMAPRQPSPIAHAPQDSAE